MNDLNQAPDTPLSFSPEEMTLYARHLTLPEIGWAGQQRLKAARVLVVGAGGLGSSLLLYLAAAGVGTIGIVDGDRVDASNLHRQVLYTLEDVGQLKAEAAKARLQALNSHIQIETYPMFLTADNALKLFQNYDIIADGTDNFPTRYLVNDACVLSGKINVYASIFKFEGQVAVFNFPLPNGTRSPNYRDLYPTPPPPDAVPSCAEAGVLGVLPGIIGTLQANEVIKIIAGVGEALAGKLLVMDTAFLDVHILKIRKKHEFPITELIDYETFCNPIQTTEIPSISVQQFQEMQIKNIDFQLIDVREMDEHTAFNLGGAWIPLAKIAENVSQIQKNKPVIIYCQSGKRSREAIKLLKSIKKFDNLFNLEGGIVTWQLNKKEGSA